MDCAQLICFLGFFCLIFCRLVFLCFNLIILRVLLRREGLTSREISFLLQQTLLVMLLLLLHSVSVEELSMLEG